MEYFVIINGAQSGPYPKDQLPYVGVKSDTFVWRQGLPDWVKAESLPELSDIFMSDSAFGGYARPEEPLNPYAGQNPYGQRTPYGQPQYGQPQYGQPQYGNRPDPYNIYGRSPEPIPHTNWLTWAIIGAVFGALFSCIGMIFGIIGITKAQKANKYYAEGFQQEGDTNNASARTMTIIALVLGGIGFLLTVTGATRGLMENLMNLAN